MRRYTNLTAWFPRQLALITLASAIAVPAWVYAQDSQPATNDAQPTASQAPTSQDTSSSAAQQQQQPSATAEKPLTPQKEGFWGRVNPFARKKWVKRQTDPINDRLSELDEVNAKNARDIKDVDERAQAGIQKAQSAADAANQLAMNANSQAQNANNTAQQASGHVDSLNTTVNGLDQYHQITDLDIKFRPGSTVLTSDAKQKLDELASSLTGREGYIVEMEAHSPGAGSTGIQSSERLAEAVKRYLVTEHQIPVYRMHAVALGNQMAMNSGDQNQNQKPERVKTNSVHVRLMENSLAARAGSSPQSAPAAAGAEQP
jgi:outer membrane protein OmpA-like peptidoglycan-associated protein